MRLACVAARARSDTLRGDALVGAGQGGAGAVRFAGGGVGAVIAKGKPDKIERALAAFRSGWPDMIALFTEGQCLTLYMMLREFEPSAEAWYSMAEGHVYTKIRDRFYDIRGRHLTVPPDIGPLAEGWHGAHRWPGRDRRKLTQ